MIGNYLIGLSIFLVRWSVNDMRARTELLVRSTGPVYIKRVYMSSVFSLCWLVYKVTSLNLLFQMHCLLLYSYVIA